MKSAPSSKRSSLLSNSPVAFAYAAAAFVGVWWLAAVLVNRTILPDPFTVAATFVNALVNGSMLGHMAWSAFRVAISVLLAVALAWPLGIALGLSPRADRYIAPLIWFTYPIPKIVLLPVVILFLGLGESSKIAIIFLILFYQILIVVRDAARGIRGELIQSVRSLGARRRHLMQYVYVPACLPAMLTALRVTTGTAIAVLFFVESFGTSTGLGYYILVESQQRLNYPQMYAGMVGMSLLGVGTYVILDRIQKRTSRWAQSAAQV